MGCHTNPPPTTNPPTMRVSGYDNVILGRRAGYRTNGELSVPMGNSWGYDDAPADGFYTCAYCGQSNAAGREGCRGCQAPRY